LTGTAPARADLHSVSQWWQRAKRCGYAYAQVSQMQGSPERKFIKKYGELGLGGDRAVTHWR